MMNMKTMKPSVKVMLQDRVYVTEDKDDTQDGVTPDKTYADVLKDLAESSSLHGIGKISTSRQLAVKLMWCILLVATMSLFGMQLAELASTFMAYPVQTNVQLQHGPISFPSITVCNVNAMKLEHVDKVFSTFTKKRRKRSLNEARSDEAERQDRGDDIHITDNNQVKNGQRQPVKSSDQHGSTHSNDLNFFQDVHQDGLVSTKEVNSGQLLATDTNPSRLLSTRVPEERNSATHNRDGKELIEAFRKGTRNNDVSESIRKQGNQRLKRGISQTPLYTDTSAATTYQGTTSQQSNGQSTIVNPSTTMTHSSYTYTTSSSFSSTGSGTGSSDTADTGSGTGSSDTADTGNGSGSSDTGGTYSGSGSSNTGGTFYDYSGGSWFDTSSGDSFDDYMNEQMNAKKDQWEEQRANHQVSYKNISREIRIKYGHQKEDSLMSVSFANVLQNVSSENLFKSVTTTEYGNCYTMEASKYISWLAGPTHGIKIIMNIQMNEYVTDFSEGYGIRLVLHESGTFPFVADEGITVGSGTETSIALKLVNVQSLGAPYGDCTDGQTFYEKYGYKYSKTACYQFCRLEKIINNCNCIPPTGPDVDLNTTVLPICNTTSRGYDRECLLATELLLSSECQCLKPCSQNIYQRTVSSRTWANEIYLKNYLIPEACARNDASITNECLVLTTGGTIDSARISGNFLKLSIFFDDLTYQTIIEEPSYTRIRFMSDVGGAMGLFMGASVLTYVELFQWCLETFFYIRRKYFIGRSNNAVSSINLK